MKQRTLGLVAVLLLATVMMVGAILLLNQEPAELRPTPSPMQPDPVLATVDGQTIGVNLWAEQYLLDQVMSHLAGQPAPTPRETLDRMINEVLLVQAYPPEVDISETEVVQRLVTLETAWEVDDATLDAHLDAASLSREVLVRTLERLLAVELAQAQLEADGVDLATWLSEARQDRKIRVDEVLFARLSPPLALTPTPLTEP